MKRKILASIIGVAATLAITSAQAQGRIKLDNYNTYGPYVVYGSGANQIAGTAAGANIVNGANGSVGSLTWTLGVYWALGDVTGSVGSDSSGFGTSSFNGLTLGAGTGSTAPLVTAGAFLANNDFAVPGWVSGPVTIEVVAYSGSDYTSSAYRGHSAAYTIAPATGSDFGKPIGTGLTSFGVFAVPEPSTFALAGLGAAALLAFRRKK
jgi:hypothetical protein